MGTYVCLSCVVLYTVVQRLCSFASHKSKYVNNKQANNSRHSVFYYVIFIRLIIISLYPCVSCNGLMSLDFCCYGCNKAIHWFCSEGNKEINADKGMVPITITLAIMYHNCCSSLAILLF
jgi:hypothetical protein